MEPVILASRSPRRSELLALAGIPFECEPADIEEVMNEDLPMDERMAELAYHKALPVFEKHPERIVIGADTIVYIDDQVIGKAHDRQEAKDILSHLSGRTHQVMTGVCVLSKDRKETFTVTSDVCFYDLNEAEIEEYLDLNEWQGKAGAYAIQGCGCRFIKEIHGDYSNIVGLPVAKLSRLLKTLKND